MSALEWLRSKAKEQPESYMTIPESEASEGNKAGLWKIRRSYFKGRLPTAMVYQLKNRGTTLTKVESGDVQVLETLKLGGQYRSEFNNCEYWYTTYEFVA